MSDLMLAAVLASVHLRFANGLFRNFTWCLDRGATLARCLDEEKEVPRIVVLVLSIRPIKPEILGNSDSFFLMVQFEIQSALSGPRNSLSACSGTVGKPLSDGN